MKIGKKPIIIAFPVIVLSALLVTVIAFTSHGSFKYDKEAAIQSAQKIIELVNKNDYQTLKALLPLSKQAEFDVAAFKDAYDPIITSAGSLVKYTKTRTSGITADGESYIYVIITAEYEKNTLTYTLTFTPDINFRDIYINSPDKHFWDSYRDLFFK